VSKLDQSLDSTTRFSGVLSLGAFEGRDLGAFDFSFGRPCTGVSFYKILNATMKYRVGTTA